MKQTYLFTAVLVIGMLVLGGIFLAMPQQTVDAQELNTTNIERQTLSMSIETSGTIAPESTINLNFGVNGTVEMIDIEVGDSVTEGQLLASLNRSDLDFQISLDEQALITQQLNYDNLVDEATAAEIAQAEASLSSAQSQLAQAQTNLDNATNGEVISCASLSNASDGLEDAQEAYDDYVNEGFEWDADFVPDMDSELGQALDAAQDNYDLALAQCDNTVPLSQYEAQVVAAQASVDSAEANLELLNDGPTDNQIASAQAQVDQAQLRLDNSRAALADAEILAPFDGVVSVVNIVEDQNVTASTLAITIVDLSTLHIDVVVDELDIPQVAVGQSALITPSAFDDSAAMGTVTRIAPVGTSTDGIITYDVRIDVDSNSTLPLFVGMTTDVEIIAGQEDDVLVVMTEAIQRDGTEEFVEVLNADNSRDRVLITTGITADGVTVIDGDLIDGMTVIIPERTQSSNNSPFGG